MTSLAIGGIVFGCMMAGSLCGFVLRSVLPEKHLSSETKDLIKLAMGLIGTMTALVVGLLIGSAKSSFDAQRNGLAQLSGNVIVVDRALAHFGPAAKETRDMLAASVADMLRQTWPAENAEPGTKTGTEGRYEGIYESILGLTPHNELQRAFQSQAMKIAAEVGQARWLLFAQKGSSVPTPFLVVLVAWLTLLMASYSLFAPPNVTVFVALLICALAAASAIFLILELDRPYDGIIQISSAPLRAALAKLGS